MSKDFIQIDTQKLIDIVQDVQELKGDINLINKTYGNDINSINRRLESLQQDISKGNQAVLDKIKDTITIQTQQMQISQEVNNKHLVKGLKEDMHKIETVALNAAKDIDVAKKQGYVFAATIIGIGSLIAWVKGVFA